ncbi:MAG: DHHA1 domain-containing protein [Myxococcota bacterium]
MPGTRPPLVIFHDGCPDGFCAAWVARKRFPDAELAGWRHGDDPPDVTGRDVWIVDFAFSRRATRTMAQQASSLRILDHHATARDDLGDLPYATFDMERSGCGLAWDTLFPDEPRPWLVDYVEDRDLWRWALPDSREVNAAMETLPDDFDAWDAVLAGGPEGLVARGRAILDWKAVHVEHLARRAGRRRMAGHDVPVVNAALLQSELGNALSEGEPFAVMWTEGEDGSRSYSLRSRPGGVHVGDVAKRFGGGGHPRAAGFSMSPGESPFDDE